MKTRFTSTELIASTEQEFIHNIATFFPVETKLLCGDVQTYPGTAIALRQVLLGGDESYKAFVKGQDEKVALTLEQFNAMHKEYNERLYSDDLIIAAIYMAGFNDVGKAQIILDEASKIKGKQVLDHDEANAIIISNPAARQTFLPSLNALENNVRNLICYSVGLDFNPSCFTQGEYPIYPITQIADALSKVPTELQEALFSLIKIESAMDVAGARGHQAPGGAAYNKFVHPAFDLAFNQLSELTKGGSAKDVYFSYIEKNASKFGLNEMKDQNERVALTRLCLMIRGNSFADGALVTEAYENLREYYPEFANCLVEELATNQLNSDVTTIWMQYSPDLLRILTKENKTGQFPIEGLILGLKIFSQILMLTRQQAEEVPCYMSQGRDIIPIVRNAANGNDDAMLILEHAALGVVDLTDGIIKLQEQVVKERKSSYVDLGMFGDRNNNTTVIENLSRTLSNSF